MAGLVVGAVAGMTWTQSLRKEGPIASDIHFKRKGGGYRVCFKLPRGDDVEVAIVESGSGDVVRTLAAFEPLEGDSDAHCFDWDGATEAGTRAGRGVYRVRIALREADRTGVSGERIRIGPAS